MNNIAELTKHLSKLYEDLRAGKIEVKVASEMNNTAGKLISAQKIQLEYSELRKESPDIDFLNVK